MILIWSIYSFFNRILIDSVLPLQCTVLLWSNKTSKNKERWPVQFFPRFQILYLYGIKIKKTNSVPSHCVCHKRKRKRPALCINNATDGQRSLSCCQILWLGFLIYPRDLGIKGCFWFNCIFEFSKVNKTGQAVQSQRLRNLC